MSRNWQPGTCEALRDLDPTFVEAMQSMSTLEEARQRSDPKGHHPCMIQAAAIGPHLSEVIHEGVSRLTADVEVPPIPSVLQEIYAAVNIALFYGVWLGQKERMLISSSETLDAPLYRMACRRCQFRVEARHAPDAILQFQGHVCRVPKKRRTARKPVKPVKRPARR